MASQTDFDGLLMGEVEPGLFIGSLQSLREINKFPPDTPWTVISILESPKLLQFAQDAVSTLKTSRTIDHKLWSLPDTSSATFLSEQLVQLLNCLDNESHHRLVHCAYGISRSSAVIAAWLMTRRGKLLEDALHEIRQVRPSIAPKMGFVAALLKIQRQNGKIVTTEV